MPQITLNLSQELIDKLDAICADAHRSRPGQVARWIDGTASGQVVDTPVYEPQPTWTEKEAHDAMQEYDGPKLTICKGGEIVDEDGDVHEQLTPGELADIASALEMGPA